MPSGADLLANLERFVAAWREYQGGERSEAQTFLNELFAAYGTDRRAVGARFEDAHTSAGIMDCHWPGIAIIEMKAPGESARLDRHQEQALRYWRTSADPASNRPAPRYVVLCSFQRLQVWEPGLFPGQPRIDFGLDELPDRHDALLFLAGHDPLFLETAKTLTTEAVGLLSALHRTLRERQAAPEPVLRRFVLQAVWCLFAEDLGLLDNRLFSRIVDGLHRDPTRSSAAELGYLFTVLNLKKGPTSSDLYTGAPYANGGLFAEPTYVTLHEEELELLAQASTYDWRQVDPTIFGSLMEGFLGQQRRWELGAHYTHPSDIAKIIGPTLITPWRERIEAVDTAADAEALAVELAAFQVLDPACGCGNFLYLAFQQLRALNRALLDKRAAWRRAEGLAAGDDLPVLSIRNLHGFEVDEFTATIARVTLWMGHKLVIDAYGSGPGERYLPLADLDGIQVGDALDLPWPAVDAIVGNPPFIGGKFMRSRLGDDYVEWLRRTFKVGVKDYCVYWFRRAHDHLQAGQRAGLVATNSVRESENRRASLDYLHERGGVITNAVSSQRWPGEANVHVSIINWASSPSSSSPATLDGLPVDAISTALEPVAQRPAPAVLAGNAGRQFAGVVPGAGGAGFQVDEETARRLLAADDVANRDVVQRYVTGQDLVQTVGQEPTRWILNFGERTLPEARAYPRALQIVQRLVKPVRDEHRKRREREQWWQFSRSVPDMWAAIDGRDRYILCPHTAKRIVMCWGYPGWCPSNATNVFPFSDSYAMGVLSSTWHQRWASLTEVASKLKSDQRYVSGSFHTFPWPPDPAPAEITAVRGAADELHSARREVCRDEQIGLTDLYNGIDDGAHPEIVDFHVRLDRAVLAAYGWSALDGWPQVNGVLYELNRAIADGRCSYRPFAETVDADLTLF